MMGKKAAIQCYGGSRLNREQSLTGKSNIFFFRTKSEAAAGVYLAGGYYLDGGHRGRDTAGGLAPYQSNHLEHYDLRKD
jgi:hypothetical protein